MGIVNRIASLFSGFNWLIIPASFIAIIFHEISHGLVACLLGDSTAKERGRLSLNPIKHMDVLGLLSMIFFGFGWAKPVPVNPYCFKNKKFGMVLVSLAGPLSNLIMAFVSLLLVRVTVTYFVPTSEILVDVEGYLLSFLLAFALLNIGLAVFNLIPVPPLDGSKILFSFLPRTAYGYLMRYEQYGMLLLIVLINIPYFSGLLMNLREWIFMGMYDIIELIF